MSQSTQAQHARWLLAGRSLATLIETALPLVIARIVDKSEAGLLFKILLIYTTVELILTSGLPVSLTFMLPGRPVMQRAAIARKLTHVLYAIGATAGVGFIVSSLIASNWVGSPAVSKLGYLALLPLGDVPSRLLPHLLIIEASPVAATITVSLRSAARVAAMLLPLLMGLSLPITLMSMSVAGLLLAWLTLFYLRRVYRDVEIAQSPVSTLDLVKFSLPVGATDLIANLNGALDKALVAMLFSAATYAEYQAGAFQIPVVPSIVYAVGTAYAPRFTELIRAGQPQAAVELWRAQSAKTALLTVALSAVFIVSAEEAVVTLFGERYRAGASVLRLYSIMTLGRITGYGTLIVSAGRSPLLFRAALVAFGANLLLSVPLVFIVGFNGPALGALLAFVPMVLIYLHYISVCTGVPFDRVFPLAAFLKALLLGAAAAAPAVLCKLTLQGPPLAMFGMQAAVLLLCFGTLGTLSGQITRNDWNFLVGRLVPRKKTTQA